MEGNASDAASSMKRTHPSVFWGDSDDLKQKGKKQRTSERIREKTRDFYKEHRARIKAKARWEELKMLVPGCSKVLGHGHLIDEACKYLQSLQRQVEESTEQKKFLEAENKQLNDENTKLKGQIGFLGRQLWHQNVSLQVETDHHGTNSEAVDKSVLMELSTSHPISNVGADITDFLKKLEDDEKSTVELSDFTDLDGECIKLDEYSIPISLFPTVINIIDVYGDFFTASKMNPHSAEPIFIMFCASIKEMSDLQLEQVTEDRILKWSDAIRDALRINFDVAFAMEHLKEIACAYTCLRERLKLENMDLRIFDFESGSSAGTEEISDKPFSPGEQPIFDNESVNGGDDNFDGVCHPIAGKKRQLTTSQDDEFLETSFEVENKLEPKSKLQLDLEAGLECIRQKTMQMKEVLRSDVEAFQEKVKELEMLKRKKLDLLAMEADKEKLIGDFMVFFEAIEKNDMEKAQNFDLKTIMDTILTLMNSGRGVVDNMVNTLAAHLDTILTLMIPELQFNHAKTSDASKLTPARRLKMNRDREKVKEAAAKQLAKIKHLREELGSISKQHHCLSASLLQATVSFSSI